MANPLSAMSGQLSSSMGLTLQSTLPQTIPQNVAVSALVQGMPIAHPQTIPPSTLPQTIPQGMPSTLPQTIPQGMPSTLPQTIPQGMPSTLPQTYPMAMPSTLPQTIPQGMPQTLPQSIPQGMPQSLPQSIPQGMPQTLPQSIPQGITSTLPQTIPPAALPSTGAVPPPLGGVGLHPLSPPAVSQLPHVASYPNLAGAQLEQTRKFEISEVSEASPLAVRFGETTLIDNSGDGEEDDTLESSDSAVYDSAQLFQTPAPITPASTHHHHLHHHHHPSHHSKGAAPPHGQSMTLPAKAGRAKRVRMRSLTRLPSTGHVPLSPVVDCSPADAVPPVVGDPPATPLTGGAAPFLPAESQALFNETFGQFLYNMHCLFTTPMMQPLLQQLTNHFGRAASSQGNLPQGVPNNSSGDLPSSQPVVSCVCLYVCVGVCMCVYVSVVVIVI